MRYRALLLHQKLSYTVVLCSVAGADAGRSAGGVTGGCSAGGVTTGG